MSYDKELWDEYAKRKRSLDTMKNLQNSFEIWQSHLRCKSVLEVGCGTGIDLRLFPETVEVHGIDLNDLAMEKWQKRQSLLRILKRVQLPICLLRILLLILFSPINF